MQSLNGRVALVTGAAQGIGKACSLVLAQDGAFGRSGIGPVGPFPKPVPHCVPGQPQFPGNPFYSPAQPAQREYLPDPIRSKHLGSLVSGTEYFVVMAHPALQRRGVRSDGQRGSVSDGQ